MMYAYKRSDESYIIFNTVSDCPDWMRGDLIEVSESDIPKGVGELRRDSYGNFYLHNEPDVSPEPEPEPVPPVETIEEKINNLFNMTEQNNLITVDAVLGVYEEVLALREEVAALKETTNNA